MRGFTFLELMIALVIFSMGLLGLLQLQLVSRQQLQESMYGSRAIMQAYNLLALNTMFATTRDSSLSQQLYSEWNKTNATLLPNGEGLWVIEEDKHVLSVFWDSIIDAHFCDDEHRACVKLQQGM
jgi:prepilin-type N-terminal cleavage/methylation domain-containing protein